MSRRRIVTTDHEFRAPVHRPREREARAVVDVVRSFGIAVDETR